MKNVKVRVDEKGVKIPIEPLSMFLEESGWVFKLLETLGDYPNQLGFFEGARKESFTQGLYYGAKIWTFVWIRTTSDQEVAKPFSTITSLDKDSPFRDKAGMHARFVEHYEKYLDNVLRKKKIQDRDDLVLRRGQQFENQITFTRGLQSKLITRLKTLVGDSDDVEIFKNNNEVREICLELAVLDKFFHHAKPAGLNF